MAKKAYETSLSENRERIALNKETFYDMDNLVSEAIKKSQRFNHIIASNELSTSRASIYRYVKKGYIIIKPIDLPRMSKFRKRRTRELPPISRAAKLGRSYNDFQKFLLDNNLSSWLEMDNVFGIIGGKRLLIFNVTFCNFIFARLLNNKTTLANVRNLPTSKRHCYEADSDFH